MHRKMFLAFLVLNRHLLVLFSQILVKMYTIKVYLDTFRATAKGYPVKWELSNGKKQLRRSIKIYQHRKRLLMTPEIAVIHRDLLDRLDYINKGNHLDWEMAIDVMENGVPAAADRIAELKAELARLEKVQPLPAVSFIRELNHEKQHLGRSTRHFEELIQQIEGFKADLDLNDITYNLLKHFEMHKRKTTKTNGSMISKTFRTLRTVHNEARKRRLLRDPGNRPFEGYKVQVLPKEKQEIDKVVLWIKYLPEDNFSLDLFRLQLLLGGHDFVELAQLRWANIHSGEWGDQERIQFRRFKLRKFGDSSPLVDNLLLPDALRIIEKYGSAKQERIFGNFLAEPDTERYRQQNIIQLRRLSRYCQRENIPKLGTKTPRYLFRTVGGKLGVNEVLLNQIMGHKPSDVSHRYQGRISQEEQDRVHRDICEEILMNPLDGIL